MYDRPLCAAALDGELGVGLYDATDQSTTLGKYRLLAELGRGGMAQVYLAVASGPAGFHKLLVVKQIDADLAEDPEFVTMFLDEARLAARLNHPNVVQTYEVGQDGGRYFIAMEYLEGQPFSSAIGRLARKLGVMTVEMQLRVVVEALAGLHYAHELCDFDGSHLAVVHRDMSPHNIFVTYSGQVKVVDFGIAKACTSSVRTQTGVMKGKVGYMGPEQTRGEGVDRRADVFSVGVILWEIAVGKRLFAGVPDYVVMQRIIDGDIPTPSSVCSSVSPRLEEIILQAMAAAPEDRFQTAADLGAELEAYLKDRGELGTTRDVGQLMAEHFAERRARIDTIIEAELATDAPASIADLPRLPRPAASEVGLTAPEATSPSTASADAPTRVLGASAQAPPSPSVPPAPAGQREPVLPPSARMSSGARRGLLVGAAAACVGLGGLAYVLLDSSSGKADGATTAPPDATVDPPPASATTRSATHPMPASGPTSSPTVAAGAASAAPAADAGGAAPPPPPTQPARPTRPPPTPPPTSRTEPLDIKLER